ncbi:MAG: thioredoxin family protein [Marinoscillum sp.]
MIKTSLISLFILQLSFSVFSQGGISFQDMEWNDALTKAKNDGKLLFVEGYVEWSEPCGILEEYTLTDKEVGEFYNKNFVNIRLDMEDLPGIQIGDDYEVVSYPVMLFLNGDGKLVHRGCGAIDSEEFLVLGKDALGDNTLSAMDKKFKSGERSLDFLVEYSFALENACADRSGMVETYFKETSQHDWLNETSWMMINLNVEDPYSDQIQYLIAYHDMFSLKYGKDTVDAKVYNVMLDQLIDIYEGADLTLFATQALRQLMQEVDFEDKDKLLSLANLKVNDLKENWPQYAENALAVVEEQDVVDPDQLNEFAWKFYLFVDNPEQLKAASAWMRNVLTDYPDATYYDTYASLKFKLGEKVEAVKFARLALQAAELEAEDLMHYKAQLKKFESGK